MKAFSFSKSITVSQLVNVFVRPTETYKRDIDVLKHYVNDTANFLHISTGKPLEACKQFVINNIKPGGKFEFKDPKLTYLQRNEVGDRVKMETTLHRYLGDSVKKQELIAPTLTTYLHPKVKSSLLATYIDANIKARSRAKKIMFVAKAAGNMHLHALKNIEQTNRKLSNNAISGAHVSPSTPLYNKTAHATLTSNCRTTSGYGNANNEKFLSGNRHYFNHHIVLNNIVSIVGHTDYNALKAVIDKYRINYPSVQDTLDCIQYSSQLYWRDAKSFAKVQALVAKLTPIQRAAFVYTGDFYHLMKYNNDLVLAFIRQLSTRVCGVHEDPLKQIQNAPDDHVNLGHQICSKETAGIGKDYSKIEGTPAIHTLALTICNIAQTIETYGDLIRALWVTDNLPASVSHFPDSIRRSALTSDTDSTIFTVQDWVFWYNGGQNFRETWDQWYSGERVFNEESMSVAATMIFLASATITHVLAIMSANFGIIQERLHRIAMKNEYKFDVFVPTQLGKHYYAMKSVQEGYVFTEHEMEIKGVYLKSSNAPREIIAQAAAMMEDIMQSLMKKGSLSILKYIKEVADTERRIIASIKRGEFTYLRAGSIKDAESYTAEEELSPYQHHRFWNDVFGPKYGTMPDPPYATVKVSVVTDTPRAFKNWLDSIQDRDLAERLMSWCARSGKNKITTMHLPTDLMVNGIPSEVNQVVAYRKIVTDIVKIMYLILETLGVYTMEKKVMRLLSDQY